MSRSTDPRFSMEGGRAFLRVPMVLDYVDTMGWLAFRTVGKILSRYRVAAAELEWRYAEENRGVVVAVFEVVKPHHPYCLTPDVPHGGHGVTVVHDAYALTATAGMRTEYCPGVCHGA